MKNQKYDTVGTILRSNIKIVERGTFDTPNTQIHDLPFSWLETGTSLKVAVLNYCMGPSLHS
jgi:hypothetical protein